jgi:hypothetical protein
MVLAICFPNALNNIMRWLDAVRSYASISFTLWASPFSRAWKRRVGIWLAGNLRVEVVAEQVASMHRESERDCLKSSWGEVSTVDLWAYYGQEIVLCPILRTPRASI